MRILGIDPGFGRLGYGIIELGAHHQHKVLTYGCFETEKTMRREERLHLISQKIQKLFDEFQPERLAIEELFFNKNVNTALGVGEARGVVLLVAAERGIAVSEYKPLQVKLAITGDGRADKQQIKKMVQLLLKMDKPLTQDDAADALAVALVAAQSAWQTGL